MDQVTEHDMMSGATSRAAEIKHQHNQIHCLFETCLLELATKILHVRTAPAVVATTCAGTLQNSVALDADLTVMQKPNAVLTHLLLRKSVLCQFVAQNLVSADQPTSSASGRTTKIRITQPAAPSMADVARWTDHLVTLVAVFPNVQLAIMRHGRTHAKPALSLQKISTLMASRTSTSPSVSSTLPALK